MEKDRHVPPPDVIMDGQMEQPTPAGRALSREVASNALSGPAPERRVNTVVVFPPPDNTTPRGGFFG